MPPDTLEFEEPIAVLLKEIEALSMLPQTPERQQSIDGLYRRIESIRGEIYRTLTPWQRVLVARLYYVNSRLYEMIALVAAPEQNGPTLSRFMNSLRITR